MKSFESGQSSTLPNPLRIYLEMDGREVLALMHVRQASIKIHLSPDLKRSDFESYVVDDNGPARLIWDGVGRQIDRKTITAEELLVATNRDAQSIINDLSAWFNIYNNR